MRQQLAEYEQALEEEQKADLERLEDYEAVVAASKVHAARMRLHLVHGVVGQLAALVA